MVGPVDWFTPVDMVIKYLVPNEIQISSIQLFICRAHVKQHKKIKKECPHCFVKLTTSGMWRHLKVCQSIGSQEKQFICRLCTAAFSTEYHLKQHKMRVHSVGAKHACEKCGGTRTFHRKDGLLMHLFNEHQ